MKKFIMAKLNHMADIPPGAIWRGDDGVFDFVSDRKDPAVIKELLSEHDEKGKLLFRKPGFTVKGRSELVKAGGPK